VLTEFRGAPGGYFGRAMEFERAADRRLQIAASTFERHDNAILHELRVCDDLARFAHDAERDVGVIEDLAPVVHRLCGEHCIENGGELRRVRREFCRIREARVCQQIRAADSCSERRPAVRCDNEQKPAIVGGSIDIERCIRWLQPVVQREERPSTSAAWIETPQAHTPEPSREVVTYEPLPVRSRRYKAVTIAE